MVEPFAFLILALAAWRLAYMLVSEVGPFSVFARLRYRIGVRSVPVTQPDGRMAVGKVASNTAAELFLCIWCMSVWTALLLLALVLLSPALWFIPVVLALSAGAILVQEVGQWLRSR